MATPDSNGTQGITSGKSNKDEPQGLKTQLSGGTRGNPVKERPSNISNAQALNTKLPSTPQKVSPNKRGKKLVNPNKRGKKLVNPKKRGKKLVNPKKRGKKLVNPKKSSNKRKTR